MVYSDGSLKVTDVQMKDSGVYSCEISTELDSVNAEGSITVQGNAADAQTCHCYCSICSHRYQCALLSSDKPGAPVSVAMLEKKDRSVTLSWMAGDDNNSPVAGKQKNSCVSMQYMCV